MGPNNKHSHESESDGLVFSTNSELLQKIQLGNLLSVETSAPEKQHLQVQLDTKARKGKIVTLISGFEGQEKDLEDLGKRLKTACGVGGSTKDGQIIVQGSCVDKVMSLLNEWGYTKTKRKG